MGSRGFHELKVGQVKPTSATHYASLTATAPSYTVTAGKEAELWAKGSHPVSVPPTGLQILKWVGPCIPHLTTDPLGAELEDEKGEGHNGSLVSSSEVCPACSGFPVIRPCAG